MLDPTKETTFASQVEADRDKTWKLDVKTPVELQKLADDKRLAVARATENVLTLHVCRPKHLGRQSTRQAQIYTCFLLRSMSSANDDKRHERNVYNALIWRRASSPQPDAKQQLFYQVLDEFSAQVTAAGLAGCVACGKKRSAKDKSDSRRWSVTSEIRRSEITDATEPHLFKKWCARLDQETTLLPKLALMIESLVHQDRFAVVGVVRVDCWSFCRSCARKKEQDKKALHLHQCLACQEFRECKLCSRCIQVYFCSDACLAAAWPTHRATCVAKSKAAADDATAAGTTSQEEVD